MALFSQRSRLIDTENAFKIGPYIREVEATGQRVIKCNLGEPDFPVPAHIREEMKRQIDADNTHYCDPQGLLSLREAVARHLTETRDIAISPDRVVVFPGAKPPIGFAVQTYTNPGDEVVYPSPGFPIYESFVGYTGARPRPVHLEETAGFTFTGSQVAKVLGRATRLVILNFPSNPTGGVATEEQLRELAGVIRACTDDDVRIYSDEVYDHILFDGAQHRSIASVPGMASRTIIVGGVSKTFSWTGGRVGWAAFPTAQEAQVMKNLVINYYSCVSPYAQEAARLGLESPESRASVAAMVRAFQERRDLVVAGLGKVPGVRCQTPRGAFYVFPNIAGVCERVGAIEAYRALPADARETTSPSTLFQMFLLYRHGVATMDRRSFGRIGSEGQHFLRLSIATGRADLEEAVARIARAADDRAGFAEFVAERRRLS